MLTGFFESKQGKLLLLGGLTVSLLLVPRFVTDIYILSILNMMIIYSILCMGLNLILGFTGLLSLGHAAFFGIGAYTTAILMTRYGFGFLSAFFASAVLAMLAGIVIALPTRKVRGDYFCLITLAFGEIFRLVATAWIEFTRGAMGIVRIPMPKIFGIPIVTETHFYYLGLGILIFTYLTLKAITDTRYGRAFIAIREDELAADTMGINTSLYKIMAFSIGCLFAGMAGSFLAVYQTVVTPSNFRLEESCLMIIMVIVGGMGRNLLAPLAGVVVLTVATEVFRSTAEYRMLIIGLIMILVLLLRPQGLFGSSSFKS
ncbi:MAG: branched-chain amino acid ABC transporter permease [Anaerolineaceae bacterium]|nr:branched-chain amino acid ABC transporter permease [Anaerolineaceae bacterium]